MHPVLRNKAEAAGAVGWLRDLPGIIAGLEQDWSITVGRLYDSSTEAFVAEVIQADGTPAVLKLMIPRPGDHARNEITVLKLTAGEGCVRLLRDDVTRGALLLERLGRSMDQLGLPVKRRHEILCAAAERVWRPAAGTGLPTGADAGRRLAVYITATWAELDRPCSERAALESGAGFKLVDPDGLIAEAIWEWGVAERVSTGLLCTRIALQPVGRQMLAAADRVALLPAS